MREAATTRSADAGSAQNKIRRGQQWPTPTPMRSSREHRPTLLWSPHAPDLFALGTSDKLSLFEFQRPHSAGDGADFDRLDSIDSSHLDSIGLESLAPPRVPQTVRPVSVVTDVSQLTCATWSPRADQPWTLAVGTATGKVVLHDCSPSASRAAAATSAVREFFPRQQRVCFSIAWNPVFTQLIAAGLDRDRRDYGVLVWDVERDTSSFTAPSGGTAGAAASGRSTTGPRVRTEGSPSNFISAGGAAASRRTTEHRAGEGESAQCYGYDVTATGLVDAVSSAHAYAPLANSEAAVAVSWLPESPHSLLVGTSFRWLRLFDVRARDEQLACHAHAKAVYGVVFDPFNPNRLLTFSDASDTPAGVVKGWDLRRLSQGAPLFTLAAGDAGNDRQTGDRSAASRTSQSRGLIQVGWAPTQRGLVGTMAEGATGMCVWDVDQMILVQQHQQQGDRMQQPDLPVPQAGVPPAPPPASPAHAPSAMIGSHGAPPTLRLPAQLTPRQQQQQLLGRQPRLVTATGCASTRFLQGVPLYPPCASALVCLVALLTPNPVHT
jgi:WD40 repeat protein